MSRRASSDSCATASHTRAISGTTAHFQEYAGTQLKRLTRQTDNYQTWEDPNVVHPETKAKGDNDPLDVCEIGELVGYTGQIKQVKVLGVMALLDEEETDWKIIVIDVSSIVAVASARHAKIPLGQRPAGPQAQRHRRR
jgi:hypothetical protein